MALVRILLVTLLQVHCYFDIFIRFLRFDVVSAKTQTLFEIPSMSGRRQGVSIRFSYTDNVLELLPDALRVAGPEMCASQPKSYCCANVIRYKAVLQQYSSIINAATYTRLIYTNRMNNP